MKLIGLTFTYNEEYMIPYVIPYLERMGYDKLIVYDNMSTDRTVELLSKYPFIEIRTYDSCGKFDDGIRVSLMEKFYLDTYMEAQVGTKNEEKFWVTICDFDEVLYFNDDRFLTGKEVLDKHFYNKNVYDSCMVNLYPPNKNVQIYQNQSNKQFVHMYQGVNCVKWNIVGYKPLMFLINDFPIVTFYPGHHFMDVKTRDDKELQRIPNSSCFAFHLKFIDKNVLYKKTIMDPYVNFIRDDYHNLYNKETLDKIYDEQLFVSIPVKQYMSNVIFNQEKNNNLGMIKV